jgi:hypothetical protein
LLPASVVTTPVLITIWQIRWLSLSATRVCRPSGVTATPVGFLNLALVPTPFVLPELLPASVVTTPVLITIWRIRWLSVSATRACRPSGVTATPVG